MAFTLIEVLIAIGIIGLLMALLLPAVQFARESSRKTQCLSNLRQVGVGLQEFHDANRRLPAGAIWAPPGEPLGQGFAPPGTIDRVSLGLASGQKPDRMFANWIIAILPYVEEQSLHDAFDLTRPIGDPRNEGARATDVPLLKCPSDIANGADNHFQRAGLAAADRGYARGNYAMNGGTNKRCLMRLSTQWPPGTCTDGFQVDGTNLATDTTQVWGSGIGGVNKWFRYADFSSGLSKTVAIEEIRAGIHPLDRRGVWSLGFPGCSVTVAHGIKGNGGPNAGADAIQGCGALSAVVGDLDAQGMRCSANLNNPSAEISEQATSRSMHSGGVNLLMADGSGHFVSDAVDPNVWQKMHKRDNQSSFELPF
ncbi:MAG: DUF1559 domain-containing protein [Planctomycetia bacterium]|nr:DUF1559 domain-containing protein [Planctomycetia bacterium]